MRSFYLLILLAVTFASNVSVAQPSWDDFLSGAAWIGEEDNYNPSVFFDINKNYGSLDQRGNVGVMIKVHTGNGNYKTIYEEWNTDVTAWKVAPSALPGGLRARYKGKRFQIDLAKNGFRNIDPDSNNDYFRWYCSIRVWDVQGRLIHFTEHTRASCRLHEEE
jgi:hypothetical protein